MYKHDVLSQIKDDLVSTMGRSIEMKEELLKDTLPQRFLRAVVRALSPML